MSDEAQMATNASVSVQKDGAHPAKKRSWLKLILKIVLCVIVLLIGAGWYLWTYQRLSHSEPTRAPEIVKESGDKLLDSIRRGVEYLKVYQEPDGAFSKGMLDPKPAFTALVVEALAQGPDPYNDAQHDFIRKATEYIVRYQREDGSICVPAFNLDVYSTAVSLRALKAQNNPSHAETIERAKNYLLTTQKPIEGGDPNGGGVGYGKGGKASGDVAQQWVEAMKAAGVDKNSEAFKNATKFFSRIQNNPETNDLAKQGQPMSDDGGFVYSAGGGGKDKPREKLRDGVEVPKSYGLMSYAGIKSFLFMEVEKNDPRVQSAWKWVCHHFTLEENKNIGADGLYYYYLTMAKALAAYGERIIPMADGRKVDWAKELSDRMLKLQKPQGYWKNEQSGRWLEDDQVMVTAFAIRTLAICRDFMAKHPLPDAAAPATQPAAVPAK